MIADPREIQRLRHTPGQDLLARDFRDAGTFAARRREWHNRALHRAFGVSLGLKVEELASSPDFVVVEVGPGLAYDAAGRELILSAPRTIRSVSAWEREPFLVIRSEPGGAAELAWTSADRLRPCDNVPIARLLSGFPGPTLDPSFRPPDARPPARTRIGFGSTMEGGTAWRMEHGLFSLVSLNVSVDTRAAGFTSPPCYFVWLQGGLRLYGNSAEPLPFPLHPSIKDENESGFQLRVLVDNPFHIYEFPKLVLPAARKTLSLCWLGIQMPSEMR